MERVSSHKAARLPMLQINVGEVASIIDAYIRNGLFAQPFNPFDRNDWKILLAQGGLVTEHIVREIGKVIYEMQTSTETSSAEVDELYFSRVRELRVRESFSLPLRKRFMSARRSRRTREISRKPFAILDRDAKVESFIKISESQHGFAKIFYLREDGLLASYHPDFLIKTKNRIYLAETKAENMLSSGNVRIKQLAALEWCKRINALDAELRMGREWVYVLIGENQFYGLSNANADIEDICERTAVKTERLSENLDLYPER